METKRLVQRPLTKAELTEILASIETADNAGTIVVNAVKGVFNALLADIGQTWDDYTAENSLNPTLFAIPQMQLSGIFDAAGKRARECHGNTDAAVHVMLDLVNIGPSHYQD